MAGLYIHIPFCSSRCIYCDFYSTTNLSFQDRYTDCLCREMALRADFFDHIADRNVLSDDAKSPIHTIYIGGGTPSQLSFDNMEKIFSHIRTIFSSHPKEVTMEVNPDDVTPQMVEKMKQCGVNRVSMGIQTFDNQHLSFLKRRHNAEQAINAVNIVRNAGIENVSIDLMFGFPEESLNEWISDIEKAIALDVKHISAYSLTYEKDTPLYIMRERGTIKTIDDDSYAEMYERLVEMMKAANYEHYEISNFAKQGFRSQHNSTYWQDETYLGIGAAAHSYNRKTRQWNVADIFQYMQKVEKGELPNTIEHIDATTHYNDLITTMLRTADGLPLIKLFPQQRDYVLRAAKKHIDNGNMTLSDDTLRLTRRGLYISDMIMSDLMMV